MHLIDAYDIVKILDKRKKGVIINMVQSVTLNKAVYNAALYDYHASSITDHSFEEHLTKLLSKRYNVESTIVEEMFANLTGDTIDVRLTKSINLSDDPNRLLLMQLSDYNTNKVSATKLGSYLQELSQLIGRKDRPAKLIDIPQEIIDDSVMTIRLRRKIDDFRNIFLVLFTIMTFMQLPTAVPTMFTDIGPGYQLSWATLALSLFIYIVAPDDTRNIIKKVINLLIISSVTVALVRQLNLLQPHEMGLLATDFKYLISFSGVAIVIVSGWFVLKSIVLSFKDNDPELDVTIPDVSTNVLLWHRGKAISRVKQISFARPSSASTQNFRQNIELPE